MAKRFSDIMRGPLLQQAYNRRQAYNARGVEERGLNVGSGKSQSPKIQASVKPFGHDLPAAISGYLVNANQRNSQRLSSFVGNHTTENPPNTAVRENGFNPALIKVFFRTGSAVPRTSKITGLKYLKYTGEAFQYPFGQAGTERENDAFTAISNAILDGNPTARISSTPERFRKR